MKNLKSLILYSVGIVIAGSAQLIFAHGRGGSFGTGFAGGLFGGMVGSALVQPRYREVTVVEQAPQPYYSNYPVDYYARRDRELRERERRLEVREQALADIEDPEEIINFEN